MLTRRVEALLVAALFIAAPVALRAQEVLTVRGVIANVSWGVSRGTLEVQSFQSTGKPIRSFVDGLDLSDLRAKGLPRNVFQRGDDVIVCGSPASTPRPDGLVSISADLIILEDGRQIILDDAGAKECLSDVVPAPSTAARRGRSAAAPTGSPVAPMTTSPVQPMLTPPVQPMLNSPVQPIASSPVLPLGSPRNGTTRPAVAPDQAPQRVPLDAIDLSYLQLYDHDQPVQITGRVTRVDWTQPNTYVYLTVSGVRGLSK